MRIFDRIKYAIALTVTVVLFTIILEILFIPGIADAAFSPIGAGLIFAISFLIAPWLGEKMKLEKKGRKN